MASLVDHRISETTSELFVLSRGKWRLERVNQEGSDTSKVLPCDHEKEVEDPYWLKIRKEAERYVKNQNSYNYEFDLDYLYLLVHGDFQIYDKLLKHDSLESALADRLASRLTNLCYFRYFITVNEKDKKTLTDVILRTFTEDPEIRWQIRDDLGAAIECNRDGKKSYLHCFLYSSGFLAFQAYRVAHKLWSLNNKSMARKIQKLAAEAFGIDIHPEAKIGSGVSIDDCAYGVVIGNRSVIRDKAAILDKSFYFCRGNSFARNLNYESLSAFTESVFVPYDDMSKFVTAKKKSFYRTDLNGGFHQKFNNLKPKSGQGGESYEDGGHMFHAIQVNEDDHDSHRSIQLDSSALKNTIFPFDQNDKQPPPNRFPHCIKIGAEIVPVESKFNLSVLAKTSLLISANFCLAASAVGLVAGKSLPENARIFLSSAAVFSLVGFLLCSCGYVFHSKAEVAAQLMMAGGIVAATFAFALMMGSLFIVMNLFSILDFSFSV